MRKAFTYLYEPRQLGGHCCCCEPADGWATGLAKERLADSTVGQALRKQLFRRLPRQAAPTAKQLPLSSFLFAQRTACTYCTARERPVQACGPL